MTSKLTAATALLAIGLPFAIAQAQTAPAADPHHPQGQGTPAPPTGPSATTSPASPTGAAAPPMGMMMGDMQQMMQMMRQMMQMMGGGDTGGGPGGMMGGGMPMMGMMTGEAGAGSPGMGMGHGGPGGMAGQQGPAGMPAMFHHTEGVLAFYKAELRITDAQTPQWNGFAAAVRAGTKGMRDAMQRASAQPAAATAPELLDRRVALLASQYDAAKGVAATTKALYTVLTPEQRKLWDSFMTEHMRAMRGVMQ